MCGVICTISSINYQAPDKPLVYAVSEQSEVSVGDSVYNSCILFLRYIKNIPLPKLEFAKDLTPNIKLAQASKGDVVIFDYKPYGHVAEILAFMPNGILIDQSNKVAGKETREVISYTDSHIIGYWTYKPTFIIGSSNDNNVNKT